MSNRLSLCHGAEKRFVKNSLSKIKWRYCDGKIKRLEQGTFRIPSPNDDGRVERTSAKLAMILEGIDINNTRNRKRYKR